jgi:hypothetical protein
MFCSVGTVEDLREMFFVSPDGQRFLVLEPVEQEAVTHLNVELNWFSELQQRVPVK